MTHCPLFLAQCAVFQVPSYLQWSKCWPYPGGGGAQQWSQYPSTCARTSANLTQVVAELRCSPSTSLLALEQVLTLPWWWQSSALVPVPSYLRLNKLWPYPWGGRDQQWFQYLSTCSETSADLTLVVVELKSGPSSSLIALDEVLTLPW